MNSEPRHSPNVPDQRPPTGDAGLAEGAVGGSLHPVVVPPGCACVNHDAVDCARIRDGFDTDDEHWDHRRCECGCHSRADDDDDDY